MRVITFLTVESTQFENVEYLSGTKKPYFKIFCVFLLYKNGVSLFFNSHPIGNKFCFFSHVYFIQGYCTHSYKKGGLHIQKIFAYQQFLLIYTSQSNLDIFLRKFSPLLFENYYRLNNFFHHLKKWLNSQK